MTKKEYLKLLTDKRGFIPKKGQPIKIIYETKFTPRNYMLTIWPSADKFDYDSINNAIYVKSNALNLGGEKTSFFCMTSFVRYEKINAKDYIELKKMLYE